jgi:ribosome-associated toxin RatA of RatAB toxin-antitoxin module
MKPVLLLLMIGSALPALAQSQRLEVAVKRINAGAQHGFEVSASGAAQASPAAVWKILTAYERMPDFVPNMASSRVLDREDNEAIVEQIGSARFLFIRKPIHLVVRVTEVPLTNIDIALVSGNMKHYEAHWELIPLPETEGAPGGTRILYRGKIVPDFYVPGLVGASVIGDDVRHMMEAVLARLDRDRATERTPAPTKMRR